MIVGCQSLEIRNRLSERTSELLFVKKFYHLGQFVQ